MVVHVCNHGVSEVETGEFQSSLASQRVSTSFSEREPLSQK